MKNYWLDLHEKPPLLRHRGYAYIYRNNIWEKVRCGKEAGLLHPILTISGRCGKLNEFQLLKTSVVDMDFYSLRPSAGRSIETDLAIRFHPDDVMIVGLLTSDLPEGCQIFLGFCKGAKHE